MTVTADTFTDWLAQAQIDEYRLSADQRTLLLAAFRFRQQQGSDYFANRLLGHFLLHCGSGLKVAVLARLLGIARPTASRQQHLSAKQVIQQTYRRLQGRLHGILLPRFAGPLAQFLTQHPNATRAEQLDFLHTTFGVRVSRIAMYKFCKKFGLDVVARAGARVSSAPLAPVPPAPPAPLQALPAPTPTAQPPQPALDLLPPPLLPAPPFCPCTPSTPVPSCCSTPCSPG